MKKLILATIISLYTLGCIAQFDLPETRMAMVEILRTDAGGLHIASFDHINLPVQGYVNQPSFSSELVLSFAAESVKGFTDIMELDLSEGKLHRITDTRFSEFSPLREGSTMYTLTVESDDAGQYQRLWSHDLLSGESLCITPELDNVGYFTLLGDENIALYLVEDPSRLAIYNAQDNQLRRRMSKIGRCIKSISPSRLAYVQNINETTRYLKILDLDTDKSEFVIGLPDGAEDFELMGNGQFLCASGSRLLYHHSALGGAWSEVADLGEYGLSQITRLAWNGRDKLILIYQ